MNNTLNALFTTLKWQLHDVSNKMLSIEQQIVNLEQKLRLNQQKTSNSCTIPAFILPEQEMARSHFLILQQQHQDELMINIAALQSEQLALTLQQNRLNTELKMLEKHQEVKLKTLKQQTLLTEQNNSDEWVLQRRYSK